MFVLHGTWLPTNHFFVWGEGSAPPKTRRRAAVPKDGAASPHPRLVTTAWLNEIGLVGTEHVVTASLPAVEGVPLAPPHAGFGPDAGDHRLDLVPFQVSGLLLSPLDAFLTLSAMIPSPTVQLADDWRYWAKVAQLALELLGRERFLPALSITGEAPRAYWRVLTSDRHDAERMGSLTLAMPPACKAFAQPAPEPRALLLGALDAMVDTAARAWAPEVGQDSLNGTATPGQRWFKALMEQDHAGDFTLQPIEAVSLAQQLSAWTQPLMPPPEAPFRTCLRLEAPPAGAPANPPGRLEFALQAADDPSLIIPATTVWRGSGTEAGFLARRFERPQERLLEDLARAGKIFPAIQRGLKSSHPDMVELSTAEAHAFLREAMPNLEEAGFSVLVPPWWRSGKARLGVKVTMREELDRVPGKLGHQALVDYDWSLALGDETLSREDFERLVAMKTPLLKIRGKWVELDPDQIETAIRFLESQRQGQM